MPTTGPRSEVGVHAGLPEDGTRARRRVGGSSCPRGPICERSRSRGCPRSDPRSPPRRESRTGCARLPRRLGYARDGGQGRSRLRAQSDVQEHHVRLQLLVELKRLHAGFGDANDRDAPTLRRAQLARDTSHVSAVIHDHASRRRREPRSAERPSRTWPLASISRTLPVPTGCPAAAIAARRRRLASNRFL
jgi:hypothetical protein